MTTRERVVIDTNALISRLLIPNSVPSQAVARAVDSAQLLASETTMAELADVLSRSKFDSYISMGERRHFFSLLARIVEMVPIVHSVHVCRDHKDDHILELALNGAADLIVTGDRDLLSLDPFQKIPVLTPAAYLRRSI